MSGAYPRTLNLDTLFVNTIIYKNPGNAPPPVNQVFVSDGSGGTSFNYLPSTISSMQFAVNEVDAPLYDGTVFKYIASKPYNIFSLEPGAGMQFYSNNVAGQPSLVLYGTGPEQINADGQILSFSSLQDQVVGGRTLNYVGTGGISLSVSGPTIYFNSQETSSICSLNTLVSTNLYLEATLSTLIYVNTSTLESLNQLEISSGVFALNSTFSQKFDLLNSISSYFLSTGVINISSVVTETLTINRNVIEDTPLIDSIYDPCIVYAGSTLISTNTDFLTFTDSFTNATFAIDKEYMYAISSFNGSTLTTRGQQVQVGWFPYLSTQGTSASLRNQFVPFSQQLQVVETLGMPDGTSTITNYSLRNVAKFDEICTSNNFIITAPGLYVSSLYVSSFNNSQLLPVGATFGEYVYNSGNGWVVGGDTNIKLGAMAGAFLQSNYALAIGVNTGEWNQGTATVAVGSAAGQSNQGSAAVAIGVGAGQTNQGTCSIAIGYNAGMTNQLNNSIVVNATGSELNASTIGGFFVAPIRNDPFVANSWLQYNTTTKEIVYNANGGSGALPVGLNYGDYVFYNGAAWVLGCSTISIGDRAGNGTQGEAAVAVGAAAGYSGQGAGSIAVGLQAGYLSQAADAVAIGPHAGLSNQGLGSVAIGFEAGYVLQGENGVAIGYKAGINRQESNSIAIGYNTGYNLQGSNAIALGLNAGYTSQAGGAVAIGYMAGESNQNSNAISMGVLAGQNNQAYGGIAIGSQAGLTTQGVNAVALGGLAGSSQQGPGAIALGYSAGKISQGSNAIAIGNAAGLNHQSSMSIVINATGLEMGASTLAGCFVAPIRNDNALTNIPLSYNTMTKELVYSYRQSNAIVTTVGSGNVVVPGTTGSPVSVRIQIWGAGGGGGGGAATGQPVTGGGGGGGSGRYVEVNAIIAGGTLLSYTIGNGGVGGIVNGNGTQGSSTTLTTNAGVITASGGFGGQNGQATGQGGAGDYGGGGGGFVGGPGGAGTVQSGAAGSGLNGGTGGGFGAGVGGIGGSVIDGGGGGGGGSGGGAGGIPGQTGFSGTLYAAGGGGGGLNAGGGAGATGALVVSFILM